jgi:hypothetical protein
MSVSRLTWHLYTLKIYGKCHCAIAAVADAASTRTRCASNVSVLSIGHGIKVTAMHGVDSLLPRHEMAASRDPVAQTFYVVVWFQYDLDIHAPPRCSQC